MTVGNRGYDTMALSGERKPCLRGMRPSEVRVSLSLFRYIERIAMVLIGTVLMSRIIFFLQFVYGQVFLLRDPYLITNCFLTSYSSNLILFEIIFLTMNFNVLRDDLVHVSAKLVVQEHLSLIAKSFL